MLREWLLKPYIVELRKMSDAITTAETNLEAAMANAGSVIAAAATEIVNLGSALLASNPANVEIANAVTVMNNVGAALNAAVAPLQTAISGAPVTNSGSVVTTGTVDPVTNPGT